MSRFIPLPMRTLALTDTPKYNMYVILEMFMITAFAPIEMTAFSPGSSPQRSAITSNAHLIESAYAKEVKTAVQ